MFIRLKGWFMEKDLFIVGLIMLYAPKKEDITRIEKYAYKLDYILLMDDTGVDSSSLFDKFIKLHKGKYICNKNNLGLTASANKGFKEAIKLGADWILIMNPDGTFSNDAISIYKKYIELNTTKDVAIVCPQYNFDRHPRQAKVGYKMVKYTDMAGSLYNAKILKELNYYDKNTYFYGLDTEYCLKVINKGYKIIRCNQAILNHHPAHTETLKIGKYTIFKYGKDAPLRYYYQFRSGYYIHEKYHNLKQDLFMVYKFLKVLFLFDDKKEYLIKIKEAKKDFKTRYFGPYKESH